MTAVRRRKLARSSSLVAGEVIYQTPDGLDVDASEQYELVRRRVLFEDVRLVTLHRRRGLAFLLTTGIIALFFIAIGLIIATSDAEAWSIALIFFLMASPAAIAFTVRAIFGSDVVTVFGRRSKASLPFGFRRERARRVYIDICAAVRNAQRVRTRTTPGTTPRPVPPQTPIAVEGEPPWVDERQT